MKVRQVMLPQPRQGKHTHATGETAPPGLALLICLPHRARVREAPTRARRCRLRGARQWPALLRRPARGSAGPASRPPGHPRRLLRGSDLRESRPQPAPIRSSSSGHAPHPRAASAPASSPRASPPRCTSTTNDRASSSYHKEGHALLPHLLGVTPDTMTAGSLTYHLRRLRCTASSRIAGTHRNRVTTPGPAYGPLLYPHGCSAAPFRPRPGLPGAAGPHLGTPPHLRCPRSRDGPLLRQRQTRRIKLDSFLTHVTTTTSITTRTTTSTTSTTTTLRPPACGDVNGHRVVNVGDTCSSRSTTWVCASVVKDPSRTQRCATSTTTGAAISAMRSGWHSATWG